MTLFICIIFQNSYSQRSDVSGRKTFRLVALPNWLRYKKSHFKRSSPWKVLAERSDSLLPPSILNHVKFVEFYPVLTGSFILLFDSLLSRAIKKKKTCRGKHISAYDRIMEIHYGDKRAVLTVWSSCVDGSERRPLSLPEGCLPAVCMKEKNKTSAQRIQMIRARTF